MKLKVFLVCALLGALSSFARSETVIKILHIQSNPKILAIWQEAAQKFESAHPGSKSNSIIWKTRLLRPSYLPFSNLRIYPARFIVGAAA